MLDIELKNHEVELDKFVDGSFIWGDSKRKVSTVLISVSWHTEGKGKCDRATVSEKRFNSLTYDTITPFSIQLPYDAPPSYNGKLIRIIWEVSIVVEIPSFLKSHKHESSLPFRVLPRQSKHWLAKS